jgi:hypothetical protein
MDRRLLAVLVGACALLAACAGLLAHPSDEKLFFALQIESEGHVIARPRLLGESGRPLSMRLVDPARPDRPKVDLQLLPEREGSDYRVQVQLTLPDRAGASSGELAIGHAEERTLTLAQSDRPVTVRLLLMRVASPEFEAYMSLSKRPMRTS